MANTMSIEEFRKIILRNYYLSPSGISSEGSTYVPITKKTFEKLRHDPAFTENQIKTLESRVIN